MEIDEDAELMAKFVATRDRRVFRVLYDRYERPMLAHVRRFVRNHAVAEELLQEVFVRVYTTQSYRPEHRFRTWLYRVATNVCLNELRRPHRGHAHDPLDVVQPDEGLARELTSPDPTPETSLEGQELLLRVARTLEALPPKQRAAFLMVRQDGLSHEEIAGALDTSVSAVKSLVHRALDTLRREIEAAHAPREARMTS